MNSVPLTDSWFEAKFMHETTETSWSESRPTDIQGADGVWLWCPCGYGKPEFPLDGARPHAIIVSFANPIGAPAAPPGGGSQSRGGGPSRWQMSGTGLGDLTLYPSIDVATPSCWHGYIQNGRVLL